MQAKPSNRVVRQIFDMAQGLSDEKLRKVLAFVRKVKEEPQNPSPLTPKEIMALANARAVELRSQSRPLLEAQYQALLQAIEAEVEAKGITVEDFPRGD